MGVLRNLPLLICAASLAACAATIPLPQTQEIAATEIAQPDSSATAEASSEQAEETEKPKPQAPQPATASKPAKASKTATASKTSHETKMSSTTPKIGSPQWKREREEDERKEQHIKEVIEGICRGC
jgi:hypothetical protein